MTTARLRSPRATPRHLVALVIAALLALAATACGPSNSLFVPAERLSPALAATVDSLVLDEWQAAALYREAAGRFSGASPFPALERAQEDRVGYLRRIYEQYPAFPPVNPWSFTAAREVTPSQAEVCAIAAAHEQATADRYARALSLKPPPVVEQVLKVNRAATLSADLASARRCR